MAQIKFSIDGGVTFIDAPQGIRVQHMDIETSTDDQTSQICVNHTHEGVIIDIVAETGDVIGTECRDHDDIYCQLVGGL